MADPNCSTCVPDPNKFKPENTWFIPESYLGVLWDDVFQRLIVYLWYLELFYLEQKSAGNLAKLGLIDEGDCNQDLRGEIVTEVDELLAILKINRDYPLPPAVVEAIRELNPCFFECITIGNRKGTKSIYPPTDAKDPVADSGVGIEYLLNIMKIMKQDDAFSPDFKNNLDMLIDYFEKGKDGRSISYDPIPVFFLSGDGYDYFVSNIGVELVIPYRPNTRRKANGCIDDALVESELKFKKAIFDLYLIRKTATYALLVPPEKANLNYRQIDQLRTVRLNHADNNIEALINNFIIEEDITTHTDAVTGTIPADILDKMIQRLRNTLGVALEGYPDCDEPYQFPQDYDCTKAYKIDPINQALKCILLDCLIKPKRTTSTTYAERLEEIRCWFLSGSVFRRIANEVPRIKAKLWIDCLEKKPGRRLQYVSNGGYNPADGSPELDDRGCRQMFEGILEISLFNCDRMYFRGLDSSDGSCSDPAVPPGAEAKNGITPIANDYRNNEIYIHKWGVTLPTIGNGPSQAQIYASWRSGASPNPVFTDSSDSS